MIIKIYDTNNKGSDCSCNCNCNSVSEYNKDNLINDIQKQQIEIDFKIIITENVNKSNLIKELNEIFKINNERIIVNENTLEFTLSKILPLIVVDKRILCVNSMPTAKELLIAIDKNTRVNMKSSCC